MSAESGLRAEKSMGLDNCQYNVGVCLRYMVIRTVIFAIWIFVIIEALTVTWLEEILLQLAACLEGGLKKHWKDRCCRLCI